MVARHGPAAPGWALSTEKGRATEKEQATEEGRAIAMIAGRAVSALLGVVLALSLAGAPCQGQDRAESDPNYGTATPYRPRQDIGSYQPPPEGFAPVFTQLVARHGSRGLSSPK